MSAPVVVRDSADSDLAAIRAIYAHHVEHGFGSFEEVPPSLAEMAERRSGVLARGLPYLAAQSEGAVLGYAYASAFRPRAAYRYSLEDSIYVAPDAAGRGIGRLLLSALIARAEAWGGPPDGCRDRRHGKSRLDRLAYGLGFPHGRRARRRGLQTRTLGRQRYDATGFGIRRKRAAAGGKMTAPTLLEALELHKSGKIAEAETIYAALLALDSTDLDTLNLGGLALHALGQRAAAAARFLRAIELAPDFADAHANLGSVYRVENQLDEAAKCFSRALELEPANGLAANNLGLVRLDQGFALESIGLLSQARTLMPGQPDIVINLSIAYMRYGDYAQALAMLDMLAEATPKDKRAYFGKGAALLSLGRIDEARAALDRAIELDPDYSAAIDKRASLDRAG
jgi:tetratricopeptide (TPR) repeat protein